MDRDSSSSFRGIFLQARTSADGEAVGTWAVPNADDYQLRDCGSTAGSALTHTTRKDKFFPQYFEWTAPAGASATTYVI